MMTAGAAHAADALIRGLDHIPVAVKDLERSVGDFAALGFILKPGRAHADGLRNAHAKFPDGTEIELITASAPNSVLAAEYIGRLHEGDGPALLGLYAPDAAALSDRLSRFGMTVERRDGLAIVSWPATLAGIFFAGRQRSPTDRPEHFAHPNTALSLAAVWLAGATAERRLLRLLSPEAKEEPRCGPFGTGTAAFSLPEAEVVFLPVDARLSTGRAIVAATVTVRSLEAARTILAANRVPSEQVAGCGRNSLWVGPTAAHGMWLELREAAPAR